MKARSDLAIIGGVSLFFLAACGSAPVPSTSGQSGPADITGLVVYDSHYDVATTVTRLSEALRSAGGSVVSTPEPASFSRTPGEPLPVTDVVVGGTPMADAALVTARQQAAINLPQKYLVRAGSDNQVEVAYNSAGYLAAVSGADLAASASLGELSARVVSSATGSTRPAAIGGQPSGTTENYLKSVPTDVDINTTVSRLCDAAARQKLPWPTVLTVPAAGGPAGPAATTVVLVQNPPVTTQLVRSNPWTAIDLPPRFLVWQDSRGQTMLSYPNVDVLAARYRLPATSAPVNALRDWFSSLAGTAAGAHD
jgi:uncharacterized protein (DUF302 family)